MNSRPVPILPMGLAFAVALILAGGVFTIYGGGEKAVRTALDVTARWSFLLFWTAYCGGALTALFGPAFAPLARGRDWGLAFASAHLVHIGLIVRLGLLLNRVPLHGALLIFFALAIVFTYLLAALSFGLADLLGPALWRAIMFLGLNYILIAFARDFVLGAIQSEVRHREFWRLLDYGFFAGLCIIAPLLRLSAGRSAPV
ncbi:MAG TPA: hypothetical protein VHV26_15705 [Rhizomicrobium sp.]|nr:hypothetical protein [Rhizomicrobium sp.]